MLDNVIFLANELQNPSLYCDMRLPFTFITFGFIKGKMYRHYHNYSTFVSLDMNKKWGNEVVYGGLFLCHDFDYYARILDAYHVCSMSTLYRNHQRDIHHRVLVEVTTIHFNTLDDLARLKYEEVTQVKADTYIGNPCNPKIQQRVYSKIHSYRVIDGIDAESFKNLFREVNHG